MTPFRVAALLLCFAIIIGSGAGGAIAVSEYSIQATESIETPSRTISVSGSSWTVSSVGHVDAGSPLTFSVETPGDPLFTLYLYNSERQIVQSKRGQSDGTFSFETAQLSAGTYILALSVDGSIQTIQPVIISGYTFDVQAPNSVSENETIEATVTLTESSGAPSSVDVLLMNGTWRKDITMTKVGENTYNVLISEDLAPGTYTLYAGTRGTDTIDGERELTGISAAHSISVEAATTTTTTSTTSGSTTSTTTSSTSSSSSGAPATDATTISTTPTTTVSTTPATSTVTTTSVNTTTASATSTTSTTMRTTRSTTTSANTTATTTDNIAGANVIEPKMEQTAAAKTPGFSVMTALLALVSLAFYLVRD